MTQRSAAAPQGRPHRPEQVARCCRNRWPCAPECARKVRRTVCSYRKTTQNLRRNDAKPTAPIRHFPILTKHFPLIRPIFIPIAAYPINPAFTTATLESPSNRKAADTFQGTNPAPKRSVAATQGEPHERHHRLPARRADRRHCPLVHDPCFLTPVCQMPKGRPCDRPFQPLQRLQAQRLNRLIFNASDYEAPYSFTTCHMPPRPSPAISPFALSPAKKYIGLAS